MNWTPSFDASSLSAVVPTLPKGAYAGYIKSATISGKENKQYFNIQEVKVWDGQAKAMVPVLNDDGSQKYGLNARIFLQVVLLSERAKKVLGRDEPLFTRWIDIRFNDNFQIDKDTNQQYRTLLDVLGLTNEDFGAYVSFTYDPDITVPEALANEENAVAMLNALEYWKQYFNIVTNSVKDQKVKTVIEEITKSDGTKENQITLSRTSCGFVKYEEGSENDYIGE